MNELLTHGATELGDLTRTGEVSSTEVVAAHLERIEEIDPAVHALTEVLADEAMAAAHDADRLRARGDALGPLHGVPVTVKGNIDVAGTATTMGVSALAGDTAAVAPEDAPAVAGLRRAGAIVIARTNLPDFALRWHTESDLIGPTRNPWAADRTPGGSSGGEAAALATAMTPLGLGTDLGGSVRWPAVCCGIVGLKTTAGRIPHASALAPVAPPLIQATNTIGPLARRTEDLRLALDATGAPHPRDPFATTGHIPPGSGDRDRRVAMVVPADTHPDIRATLDATALLLDAAGYDIVDTGPPGLDDAARTWAACIVTDLRRLSPLIEPLMCKPSRQFLDIARDLFPPLSLDAYQSALEDRVRHAISWATFQATCPLVLGPVSTQPPFRPGDDIASPDAFDALRRSLNLTTVVNYLGLPSGAIATGTSGPAPIGVQIIGPRWGEQLVLDALEAIEAQLPRRTPIDIPQTQSTATSIARHGQSPGRPVRSRSHGRRRGENTAEPFPP